jgi:D-serine deaminase-like pyridoxal phosphate-dependent protein
MIKKPTLLLDRIRCERNINAMLEKTKKANVAFRPHFKTHQSLEVGEWFIEKGIKKATVSSLTMAKYFANGGWNDITVAFPVNILEIDTLNELAGKIQLNLLVLSVGTLIFLEKNLKESVNIFIKLDTGYHRTGVVFNDFEKLDKLIFFIEKASKMNFKGFLHHAGHSYNANSKIGVAKVHEESLANMGVTFNRYKERFPNLEISIGDTPTCSVMDEFGCATEIRPGNFAFYDLMMIQIGACDYDQIAVAVACPVVAKHPERNEIMVYGGGVHFSKEVIQTDKGKFYGVVVENEGKLGWGKPIENVILAKISQEHGTIQAPKNFIDSIKIGDIVKVLPVHSCMTADLLKGYLTTEGKKIEMMRVFD